MQPDGQRFSISALKDEPVVTRRFFEALFDAAIGAADPAKLIRAHLPDRPRGRTIVVGAGKGSAQMARALEEVWEGSLEGAVVTRYGYGCHCRLIDVMEASHPVPDAAGLRATERLFDLVQGLTEDDLVIALISGGGSSLLPAPPPGMTLDDEIAVNQALLASGAPISAMNTIRKHMSLIKGGRLALAAAPAKVVSLIVSDIPGDNPAHVASGPTVADTSSRVEAQSLVASWRIDLPEAAQRHLESDAADAPTPSHPWLARNEVSVIASAALSLDAAAAKARQAGIEAVVLADSIEGEARDVGLVHAALAKEIASRNRPFSKPILLLSGGETTVTLRNSSGKGGRNTEFLLSFLLAIDGIAGIHGFAADTDGVDGSEQNAGAFADWRSASRMLAAGFDPRTLLNMNQSWEAFNGVGDLFEPGPTGTNVNDLRGVLIL